MTDIELEEGEAYFFQDDDKNIDPDPDRDFSYIDKKIENVLGHYQKDFMGGLSAESLGARFGGYGSFLPMQQRSPPILSDQRSQSHVISKSPQDLPSERFHQKPAISANNIMPARSVPASGEQNVEALSESGISSLNNQSKIQSSGEVAFNHQKKKVMMHPQKNALKFRVKMASENISRLDKSAIYSGLGLDMSPTSSPEGSPSENVGTSIGLQKTNLESPSFIVKTMTTMPLSSIDLLSPLHDSLVYLRGMENNSWTGLPGIGEAYAVNTVPASMCTKVKKEKKSKVKDASKLKKLKNKEANEERLSKQKVQALKSVELAKENCEYPGNIVALSATRRKEDGASATKEFSNASINAVAYSEEKERASLMSRNMGSNPSTVSDKRNEAGCLDEDTENPMKQVQLTKHKTKVEPVSAKKNDVENDMNATNFRGKIKKEKSFDFIRRSESSIEKRDEYGWIEGEVNKSSKQRSISRDKVKEEILESAHHKDIDTTLVPKSESIIEKRNDGLRENEQNKFLKQQSLAKDKVKEEVLHSPCPNGDAVYKKENGVVEKNPKDEEVCFISQKDEENDKYNDDLQHVKFDSAEVPVPLKQKSHSREMTLPLTEQSLRNKEENSSSVFKKKLKGSHIGGGSAVEPPKGSLVDSSSAPQNEGVISKNNIPSESKKGDTDLRRKTRKNIEVAGKGNSRKKGKAASSDFVIGVSEPEAPASTMKQKDTFSSNKPGLTSNVGSNMKGDLAGLNCLTENVDDVQPVENDPVVTFEEWVECVKCHKWRLLPLGMSSDSLKETKWTCRLITWLPGMNKCNFSEDETADALRALYVPLDPALVQNNQPAYLDANASANVSADALNVVPPNHATGFDALPSGGKRKNLVKTEIDSSRQSGSQDLHIPAKKDQQHFNEMKNSKNLKKLPRELSSGQKSGDGKSSKIEKKRLAGAEAHVVPKKMKMGHQQPEADCDPGPLRVSQDLARVSSKCPLVKAKDKTQSYMTSMDEEMYDVSGKKRKLKDKPHGVAVPSGKGGNLVKNCDVVQNIETEQRKAKKSKSSNFRESSAGKRRQRAQSDDHISNLGDARDSSLHKGGRSDDMHLEQYRGDRVSRKTPGCRISPEMALDLGLSDNAATSSFSKISCKVKAKMQGLKSSSVASNSSSPIKALKSDPDKRSNKKFASHSEHRPNSGAEIAENEFAPHNEGFRDRKPNLSRNPIVSDAADEDHFAKKVPSGRHSSANAIDTQPKLEDYKSTGGKSEPTYEGTSTSQQNSITEIHMTKSPIKLPFDGTNSEKGKSRFSKIDNEKEVSSNSHGAPQFEGGSGSIDGRVDNVNGMLSRQVVAGHVSLRQWHNTGHATNDIEASSSRKNNNIHGDAKTTLREAKDLKHSANRLKVAGSGLESTGIFFQAALKFLHGASLLEPNNNESRSGEMSPNEVYASTARLCEYCALEYERCNDMASAALAYKCMEVAYMRVVYCNDLAASRDRQELQKAVRAAPQVDSPSSSASDIDNLNQGTIDTFKDGHSTLDHRSHIVSAGNRPNFMRLLDFTHDINLAMEASRRSQGAFAAAMSVFTQAGNEDGISSVKNVLDFSFHDVDGLLHLVRLAMESIKP